MSWANLIGRVGQARNSHQRARDLLSNVRGTRANAINAFELQSLTPLTTPESTIGPGSEERLVSSGKSRLGEDLAKYDGDLPEDYYVEFAHHLYEDALSRNGNNPALALQELYESLNSNDNYPVTGADGTPIPGADGATQTLSNRYNQEMGGEEFDKVQHYLVSAYLAYFYGGDTARILGFGKEFVDIFTPGDASWSDVKANNQGINFGEQVRQGNVAW